MRSNRLAVRFAMSCAVMFVALALTLPVAADPVSKSIDLLVPAKIGRTQLDVGQYKIIIDGNKITVKQGKKVLAETTGEFVERPTKQSNNAIVVGNNGELQEVRFAGDKRVLIINN